jgi:hypothetical protein
MRPRTLTAHQPSRPRPGPGRRRGETLARFVDAHARQQRDDSGLHLSIGGAEQLVSLGGVGPGHLGDPPVVVEQCAHAPGLADV